MKLPLFQGEAADGPKRIHEFQKVLGIFIHEIQEDGTGHIEEAGIFIGFIMKFGIGLVGCRQVAHHFSQGTGLGSQ